MVEKYHESGDKEMKKISEFDKIKSKFALTQLSGLFSPLLAITVLYAMLARLIFGENYYISIVLAGILGGLWSLVMAKGYDMCIDNLNRTEKNWHSTKTYETILQKSRKFANRGLFVLIIEIVLIIVLRL